jgi:mannose-1-phosphate guanylyltransferase
MVRHSWTPTAAVSHAAQPRSAASAKNAILRELDITRRRYHGRRSAGEFVALAATGKKGGVIPYMARAMILAAGLGTRLRPLTDELPKPLVPVGDKPALAHIIECLGRGGFAELVLNSHHGASHLEKYIRGLPGVFHLVYEDRIRGTAGGIAGAREHLGPAPVVVWNGDIMADPPFTELLHAAAPGPLAMLVAPLPLGTGTVGVSADGRIVRLRAESFGVERTGGDYVGVAALGDAALSALPAEGCLVADYALPLLRNGGEVRAVGYDGSWTDVGSVSAYHAANLKWLVENFGEGASSVHDSARIGNEVTLASSVVGAGAHVEGAGKLERVVIWPGAHVLAPLAGAIVTTRGTVVPV